MKATYKKVRVLIASPSDVTKERDRLIQVISEFNRSGQPIESQGFHVEALDWRTHVHPEMGRPEQVILNQLPVNSWDIFVGIMWTRFGTPTGKLDEKTKLTIDSGTYEEFQNAYDSWKVKQRPLILFYRCRRKIDPAKLDPAQTAKVDEFFKQFSAGKEHEGIYTEYDSAQDFERKVRTDLQKVILSLSRQEESSDEEEIEKKYLRSVLNEHSTLKLYGFQSSLNVPVQTMKVFTSLRLSRFDGKPEGLATVQQLDRHLNPEEALRTAVAGKRLLLIIGDPGGGKTTLLKYYAVSSCDVAWSKKVLDKASLIPILLPLRKVDPAKTFSAALSEWFTKSNCPVSEQLCEHWLGKRGALVLLDGLDEISDVKKRQDVCDWIDRAFNAYRHASVFAVTSRFTGYRVSDGVELHAENFRAELLDFDRGQQKTFLEKWFEATLKYDISISGEESENLLLQARASAAVLMEHLQKEHQKSLRQLAGSPMLLQIIAILWKEFGNLPPGRATLYERCIDYVLDYRDREKHIEPLLPSDDAKLILRPVSLYMQEQLESDEILKHDMEELIRDRLSEVAPSISPREFIKNLIDRASILQEIGNDACIFRHKSFREFLAAGRFAEEVSRTPSRALLLVENLDNDWWRETVLFAASSPRPMIFSDFFKYYLPHERNSGAVQPTISQIIAESRQKELAPFKTYLADPHGHWQNRHNALEYLKDIGKSALPLVEKVWEVEQEAELAAKAGKRIEDAEKHTRVRSKAEEILRGWESPLVIRLQEETVDITVAGKVSQVQPRIFSPIEYNAEYILIPGGKYKYSVTKMQTEVAPLYVAKYAVTNKQYRRFMQYLRGEKVLREAESYPLNMFADSLVAHAKPIKGMLENIGDKPSQWTEKLAYGYDDDKRFNGDDQPVVGVSWYAAAAYCHWLTGLSAKTNPKEKLLFKLPIEEEWEWAASGGKRTYPWGDEEPDTKRANYGINVGQTTVVGSYPSGATPEGLMDMAGNVWEWMENRYSKKEEYRALRGGSWDGSTELLRCGSRYGDVPDVWDSYGGFRVVCSQS